jgi:hypothetical protein
LNLRFTLSTTPAAAEVSDTTFLLLLFWGLYVHVCKMETLQEAYRMAKNNDGAPGVDGVTFEAIEESGRESFLKQM